MPLPGQGCTPVNPARHLLSIGSSTQSESGRENANSWLPLTSGLLVVENRQLRGECPPEGGPRFAAGNIGGEIRIVVQYSRSLRAEQHRHHQKIARVELTLKPVCIAKARGELVQRLP